MIVCVVIVGIVMLLWEMAACVLVFLLCYRCVAAQVEEQVVSLAGLHCHTDTVPVAGVTLRSEGSDAAPLSCHCHLNLMTSQYQRCALCVCESVILCKRVSVYRSSLASGLIDQISDVGQVPAKRFSQHAQRLHAFQEAFCAKLRLLNLAPHLIG